MTDLLLALAHHFLVFALAGILAAEAVMLQPGLDRRRLATLGTLDTAYGIVAVLIIIVGASRVMWGVRGPEFFVGNPWFWAKMVVFLVVGILSAPPTIRFIAWRRAAKEDADFVVTAQQVAGVRRFFIAEIALFALIPLLAAAMVRVPFL
jgi:putative membrane protein